MAQQRTIEYVLSLTDNLSSGLKSAQGNLKQMGGKLEAGGKRLQAFSKQMKGVSVAATALGAAAVGVGIAGAKMAADFEKGMREVATLTPDVEKQLAGMSEQVLDLSARMGIDAVQATGALYQAISAGVPADNALSFMEVASKAAIGGVTDLETSVDGLTTVMNAFRDQNVDVNKAADVMFTAVKLGKTTFEELSSSMFNVAPLAAAVGVKFEDVAASIATMTKQGTPTSVATTQIRAALQGLLRPSEDMTALMQEMGYESAQLALEQDGLHEVLSGMLEMTGGNVGEMQKLLGSVEAVQAALTIGNLSKSVGDLHAMREATGAAEDAFAVMAESTAQQWAQLTQTLKTEMIKVGSVLLPLLNRLIQNLLPLIQQFKEWVSNNQTLAKAIGIFTAVVVVLLAVLAPLAAIIGAIMIGFGSLALPVLAVVAAIAALAAGAFVLVKHWEQVKVFLDGLKQKIIEFWENVKQSFLSGVQALIEAFTQIPEALAFLAGMAVQGVINYFKFLFRFWTEMVPAAIIGTINWFRQLPERIVALAQTLWPKTQDAFIGFKDSLIQWAKDTATGIIEWFTNLPERIVEAVSSAGEAARSRLGSILSAFSAGREAAGRQAGGPVQAGRPFIVGERGPELFIPQGSGRIEPGIGTQNVTININAASDVDIPRVVREIERVLGAKSLNAQFGVS